MSSRMAPMLRDDLKRASRPDAGGQTARVAMVQGTGRLHYALPIALQRAGMLERVFVDFYLKPRSPITLGAKLLTRMRPGLQRRVLGRHSAELDAHRVFHNPLLCAYEYFKRPRGRSGGVPTEHWIATAAREAAWIRRRGLGSANALMGFITSIDPAMFRHYRQRGIMTVGEQIGAPIAEAVRQNRLQHDRFPGWEPPAVIEELQRFEPFVLETWEALDHITCGSEYVRRGLIEQGISPGRVTMSPYPIDLDSMPFVDRSSRSGRPTVGFVGAVNLNKGAPYFLQMAGKLAGSGIRFVMVGAVQIDRDIAARHQGEVELIGRVPKAEVMQWLSQFDVFVFPSTCEGCASSVIEAMASGLPVVCSPNSGTFARDGQEGFLRPYDDVDGMAECVQRLIDDNELRLRLGRAARQRVEQFNLDAYSDTLGKLFTSLVNRPK